MSAPLLRADLTIVEQIFRNEQSFVVKDPTTHKYFRFRPVEIRVMRLFDGARSAADVAEQLVADGVRVSVATVEGFARKLLGLGLLERTLVERTTQQLERLRAERRRTRSLIRGELLRLRFSFGDPDAFLTRTYPLVRWCFTPAFVITSLVLFAVYTCIVISQRETYARDLTATFSFGAMTPWSIIVLIIAFSLLTAIHELGHAYACKHFGGKVHEMGVMLLFCMPAFYANVNDAWSFPERRARLWVTAAGAWIEFVVTAVIAIVWLLIAPGSVLSQLAIAAMLVGGIFNLLTNANPLLPLDGYFALGDWLEITNLRQRSQAYAETWIRRHALREEVQLPALDRREARILLGYGASSWLYGTVILVTIALSVIRWADHTLGMLVSGLLLMTVLYMTRGIGGTLLVWVRTVVAISVRALAGSSARRARWRNGFIAALLLLIIFAFVPVGLTASGTFVVLPSTALTVTAPSAGVVASVFVREGDVLALGAPVLRLANFDLVRTELRESRSDDSLRSWAMRARARARSGDVTVLDAQSGAAAARLGAARRQAEALSVRAGVAGMVVSPRPEQLLGRRVHLGDTLLQLADLSTLEAVVQLRGAGALGVRVGNPVRMLSLENAAEPLVGVVESVAAASNRMLSADGVVEVRVKLSRDTLLRAGASGEARVVWRRSTLLGAIVWNVRSRLRSDLLL